MSNYTHQWRLNWVQRESFEGVTQVWTAEGDMFLLEIQEQSYDDAIVGTVWTRVPATFWEPEDIVCIHEQIYESISEAKFLLERFDEEVLREEQENEARLEQAMLEA